MIKVYVIEIEDCRDCPNHKYVSGMMEHSWCKETGDEILVKYLSEPPHFPPGCPLKTLES